jgi:hypothetical protein
MESLRTPIDEQHDHFVHHLWIAEIEKFIGKEEKTL